MRSVLSIVFTAWVAGLGESAHADSPGIDDPPVVVYESVPGLRDALVAWSARRLAAVDLFLDARSARMTLVRAPAFGTRLVAVPLWTSADVVAGRPMEFALRPVQDAGDRPSGGEIRLTLAAPVLRDVWVAARRLSRGEQVSCADMTLERRGIRAIPEDALALGCDLPAGAVALRDVGAHDVFRRRDAGRAPALLAGSAVQVTSTAGAVAIVAEATALADATLGDTVEVRLRHPLRTLKARVTGPGTAALTGELP